MSQTITATSRASLEFTIRWQEGDRHHHDSFTASLVNLWRDILDPRLVQGITGRAPGEKVEVVVPAAEFVQPYVEKNVRHIRAEQLQATDSYGNPITLRAGRYYPQRLLRGVDGAYPGSVLPFRLESIENGHLLINLNHPLAGRDLTLTAQVLNIQAASRERGGRCEHWLERISADGPGMQASGKTDLAGWLTPEALRRADNRPDDIFYRHPRLVHHLDQAARTRLTSSYGLLLAPGSKVLDLMASWHSHLPETLAVSELAVIGMNEEELRQNSRATTRQVFDLNSNRRLPFADASFDAITITASIEYLTDPIETLREAGRVLRPGGVLIIAFTNRWFPPKAIHIWQELHDFERLGLVAAMVSATGAFTRLHTSSHRGATGKVLNAALDETSSDNPLFLVWAYR